MTFYYHKALSFIITNSIECLRQFALLWLYYLLSSAWRYLCAVFGANVLGTFVALSNTSTMTLSLSVSRMLITCIADRFEKLTKLFLRSNQGRNDEVKQHAQWRLSRETVLRPKRHKNATNQRRLNESRKRTMLYLAQEDLFKGFSTSTFGISRILVTKFSSRYFSSSWHYLLSTLQAKTK